MRVATPSKISPSWNSGDPVRWKGRTGIYTRDVGDGEHAEIGIDGRVYRARISELA
jgi:hypothetical protein